MRFSLFFSLAPRLVAIVCALVGAVVPAVADNPRPTTAAAPAPSLFDPARHMRVAEVREGMTGYGLSVFQGTKIERFDVRVISVLRNFNPKYDVVLIDCSGCNLEHTGTIAGMSGSPIYLKDEQGRHRLIGALAYGWPFVKDAVAGVQPIEYMLDLPVTPSPNLTGAPHPAHAAGDVPGSSGVAAPQPRMHWSLNDCDSWLRLLRGESSTSMPVNGTAAAAPRLGSADVTRMQALATPLMTAGLSPKLLEQFAPAFRGVGLVPLQAGGGSSATAAERAEGVKLEPGSVLAVPLIRGDAEMTPLGTCTEVLGDRIYGFGHAFNNEGPIALPMGSGKVNAVIANLNSSFKLGAMTREWGTLLSDQTVGVAGRIGDVPAMIPMDVKLIYTDGSQPPQEYHFELARHPKFTPLIAAAALGAAISGTKELPQYHTVDYDLNLEFLNGKSLQLANSAVNLSAADLFVEVGIPIVAAADNPFERVLVKRIRGTVRVTPEAREAKILSVSVPRGKYQPGEVVKIFLTYRPFRAAEAILTIDFELPRELPDGTYPLVVTDWATYFEGERNLRPFRFEAENGEEVFAVLKDLLGLRHNAVYVQLLRSADGVALGRTAMPRLPSSRRQVMLGAGQSDTTPFASPTMKVVPTDLVMSGGAQFQITIDRQAKLDTGAPKPAKRDATPPAPNKFDEGKPNEAKK